MTKIKFPFFTDCWRGANSSRGISLMFRLILIFLLITFSDSLLAQSYKDSIKAQFLRYTDLLVKKDFAKATGYINPGFFKIIPKAQLIIVIEKTYNNPAFDFKIEEPAIVSIGDSKTITDNSFVKLQYSNYLTIHFKNDDEEKQDTVLTKKALQAQFGQNNVTYDTSTDTYRVFVIKNVIANSIDNRNWTFVVIEEKQKPILEKFIPKELL